MLHLAKQENAPLTDSPNKGRRAEIPVKRPGYAQPNKEKVSQIYDNPRRGTAKREPRNVVAPRTDTKEITEIGHLRIVQADTNGEISLQCNPFRFSESTWLRNFVKRLYLGSVLR